MRAAEWGRLHSVCSRDRQSPLITRLGILEGEVLEVLDAGKNLSLKGLMETLNLEPYAVAMAVGSLLRRGVVRCIELKEDLFFAHLK